jgi:hypothetical protein
VSALLLTSCSRFQDYRASTATTVVQPLSRLPCLHCCYRRAAAFKATVPVVVSTLPSSCLRHLCGAYATAMILLLSSGLRGHLRCVSADAVGFRRRQCAYADVVVSTLPSSCLRYLCGAFTTAMMLLLLLSSSLRGHLRCVSADAVGLHRRRGEALHEVPVPTPLPSCTCCSTEGAFAAAASQLCGGHRAYATAIV